MLIHRCSELRSSLRVFVLCYAGKKYNAVRDATGLSIAEQRHGSAALHAAQPVVELLLRGSRLCNV